MEKPAAPKGDGAGGCSQLGELATRLPRQTRQFGGSEVGKAVVLEHHHGARAIGPADPPHHPGEQQRVVEGAALAGVVDVLDCLVWVNYLFGRGRVLGLGDRRVCLAVCLPAVVEPASHGGRTGLGS